MKNTSQSDRKKIHLIKTYILQQSVRLCSLHSIQQQYHQVQPLHKAKKTPNPIHQNEPLFQRTLANARQICAGKGEL